MKWTALLVILAVLICTEAIFTYAMSAAPGFYRNSLLQFFELEQRRNYGSTETDENITRLREMMDHNRRVSCAVLILFSLNTAGLICALSMGYRVYEPSFRASKYRPKNESYWLVLFLISIAGWAATYGVCTFLKNGGAVYDELWPKSYQLRALLVLVGWTIFPFLILPVVSYLFKFPPFGNWVLWLATISIAAMGIYEYAIHMGERGEWAGLAIGEIPFKQCYVVGGTIGVALFTKFIAFIDSRFGRKEVPEIENYHGPRCIACRSPIESGAAFCPSCGWTQPN